MSSAGSARQARRRARVAVMSLVATASLVGTYLGALRPQATYAATSGGALETRNGIAPPIGPTPTPTLSGCEDVPGEKTYVNSDDSLQAAIASSSDGDIICITGKEFIQLSKTLVLDDTSITLMGDDSSISLLPAQNGDDTSLRHLFIDFSDSGDDSVIIRSLTFTGDGTVTSSGGAIEFDGGWGDRDEMFIYDSVFQNNISSKQGGAIFADDRVEIFSSVFTGNRAKEGGAVYSDDLVDVTGSLFTENQAFYGGAIYMEDRGLDVYSSTFRGNRAIRDGSGEGGAGGAIYSEPGADVEIYDSVFEANTAESRGGALFLDDDEWNVATSTFLDNRVTSGDDTALGGAIFAIDGDLYIEESYFANNYAVAGGGVAVAMTADGNDQRFDVEQSAFVGNDAKKYGAGVYAVVQEGRDEMLIADSSFIANGDDTAPSYGGAVLVIPGYGTPGYDAAIRNTTIVGNQAIYLGAGVFWAVNKDDTPAGNFAFQLTYLTVTDNTLVNAAGGVNDGAGIYVAGVDAAFVLNSVLWNNTIADDTASDLSGTTTALAHSSVTSVDSIFVVQADDSIIGDPLLGALGDNGGPRIGANGAYYLPTRRPAWNTPVITTVYAGTSLPAPGGGAPTAAVDQLGAQRSVPATLGAVVAASRPPTPAPVIPPSAPLNVSGVGGDAEATITWSAPASAGSFPVSTFQAVVSPGGQSCLVASSPCTITGLTNGTEYTVQVRALSGAGWGAFSEPSAPFTPFTPEAPPAEKSILITGSRGEVRGRPGIIISASSTGMVGEQVVPWTKFPGQTGYTEGSSRPTIDAAGDFTWQRRTGKKVYVYFRSLDSDVKSNRVIIAAR